MTYKGELIGTIGPQHKGAGRGVIRYDGRMYHLGDAIGRVMDRDYGKQVFRVRDDADVTWVVQVENDDQRAARLAGQGLMAPDDELCGDCQLRFGAHRNMQGDCPDHEGWMDFNHPGRRFRPTGFYGKVERCTVAVWLRPVRQPADPLPDEFQQVMARAVGELNDVLAAAGIDAEVHFDVRPIPVDRVPAEVTKASRPGVSAVNYR